MRRLSLVLLAASLPVMAAAQPIEGVYVSGGGGVDFHDNTKIRSLSSSAATIYGGTSGVPGGATFKPGYSGELSIGYGLGNGVRFEVEGNYATNDRDFGAISKSFAALAPYAHRSGHETKTGVMGNVLFDMDIGSPYIFPYVGAGAGYESVRINSNTALIAGSTGTNLHFDQSKGAFAYQAILGLSFPIPGVVGLSATAEYRFLGLSGNRSYAGTLSSTVSAKPLALSTTLTGDDNHQLMIGVRYAFNVPTPEMPAPFTPIAAVAPAPAASHAYLVFFDWDSAALSARAQQIIADAAKSSTATTRIDVAGHADKSGTPAYNQTLSLKRANVVAAELVRLGVPKPAISISAFGDTKPLVPTAPGLREPQNRRVEIVLK